MCHLASQSKGTVCDGCAKVLGEGTKHRPKLHTCINCRAKLCGKCASKGRKCTPPDGSAQIAVAEARIRKAVLEPSQKQPTASQQKELREQAIEQATPAPEQGVKISLDLAVPRRACAHTEMDVQDTPVTELVRAAQEENQRENVSRAEIEKTWQRMEDIKHE